MTHFDKKNLWTNVTCIYVASVLKGYMIVCSYYSFTASFEKNEILRTRTY